MYQPVTAVHNCNLHQSEEKLLLSGQGQLEQVQFYKYSTLIYFTLSYLKLMLE